MCTSVYIYILNFWFRLCTLLYNCDEQFLRYGSLCEPMSGHDDETLRKSGLKRLNPPLSPPQLIVETYKYTNVDRSHAPVQLDTCKANRAVAHRQTDKQMDRQTNTIL